MADAPHRPVLSSALCYQDPKAALKWLEAAFGFEPTMIIVDQEGNLAHSEMQFDGGVIMVGNEWSADHKSPASIGGKNTQTVHVQLVDDIDAHYERALAAGARIDRGPHDHAREYRVYEALDIEGHRWRFLQWLREVPQSERH